MLAMLAWANLAVSFGLELCMLAALAAWGFYSGGTPIAKAALAISAPLLAAVVWGVFVSPKARVPLREPWHLLLVVIIFGLAVAALFAAGRPGLAWALSVVFVVNRVLLYVLKAEGAGH